MFCSSCGKEIPNGASFCANCGVRVGLGVHQTQTPTAVLSLGGKELTLSNGKLSGSYYTARGALVPMDNCVNLPLSKIASIEVKERGWAWWEILLWIILLLIFLVGAIIAGIIVIRMGRFKLIVKERNGNIITIPLLRNEVDKARAFASTVENERTRYAAIRVQQQHNTPAPQQPSYDAPKTSDGRFIID